MARIPPPWQPQARKIAARNARLHRLKRAGLLSILTKQQQRELLAEVRCPPAPARDTR